MSDSSRPGLELAGTSLQEIEEELVSLAEMQSRIMPDRHRITAFGRFDSYGRTLPTAVVGGDFFDTLDLERRFRLPGRMAVVVADASGHGLSAAMLIRDFNTALYTAIAFQAHYEQETTPLLFGKINRRMYRSSLPNQYITAFYGELELDGRIRYSNAGHLPPVLISRHDAKLLDVGGLVLGAFKQLPFEHQVGEAQMESGDLLICYTDGVMETTDPNGQEYGLDRLIAAARRHRHLDARRLFDRLLQDIEEFSQSARQQDDRTLFVVKG